MQQQMPRRERRHQPPPALPPLTTSKGAANSGPVYAVAGSSKCGDGTNPWCVSDKQGLTYAPVNAATTDSIKGCCQLWTCVRAHKVTGKVWGWHTLMVCEKHGMHQYEPVDASAVTMVSLRVLCVCFCVCVCVYSVSLQR